MDGKVRDKVTESIDILKLFEPPEGYYLAFSGGKDSQCVYHLAKMAGVKFDAHYHVTSVDPPELVRFVKDNYPDVGFEIPHDDCGNPITMWNLIPREMMPPTRIARYCCKSLKESSGVCRVTLTGVRRAESSNRTKNQGVVTIIDKRKEFANKLAEYDVDYTRTVRGGVVLNFDNDDSKNLVDLCYRTSKTLVNPIISWTEDEVWEFLNANEVQHCHLYDEGFKRLGCIGCPMNRRAIKGFERWPKYKEFYLSAFRRMLKERDARGLNTEWSTPEEVMEWWLQR